MNFTRTVLASAALLGAASSPAYAVTISTTFAAGQPGTNLPIFQSFGNNVPDQTPFVAGTNTKPANSGNPVESVAPGSRINYYSSQNFPNESVGPVPLVGSYISILDGSYSVAFSGVQVFSFVFAALDTYNSVTLNYFDNATQSLASRVLNGVAICGGLSATCTEASTGRVTYDFGGTGILNSVTFATTSPAFEIDGLASAAPEPAAWALMILGFGIVGSAMRRRRRTQVRFNFA